ncbi:shikimate dehydrogenase [Methylomonas methanica]|uniref:Shikimate dehydrogenase (NADP(+)) n=1 Tax=Methylomonas methanica TaxID=421 RepID=A0A177M749_METMH|nr:shikimate dehydrogenase [Methylomonas methanica]OAI01556.1 shikimate dehydrogenase [Methylomonas methanica]
MMKIDNYAVFGQPISHSKSPRIHKLFAEQTGQLMDYVAQEVPAENFIAATTHFFAEGGKGLNCTVPLKELAWQYADHLTERARLAKAVNTLTRQADGSILGDNTDGIGLLNDLTVNHGIELKGVKILILGAGGATRGIVRPLLEQQPSALIIANRNIGKAQAIAADFTALGAVQACDYASLVDRQFDLIINATSASLSGDLPPLPEELLSAGGSCYDLAYANQATAFVKWGLTHDAVHSLDGLGMLVEQAAEAFCIWRSVRPHTAPVIGLLNDERNVNSTNR